MLLCCFFCAGPRFFLTLFRGEATLTYTPGPSGIACGRGGYGGMPIAGAGGGAGCEPALELELLSSAVLTR